MSDETSPQYTLNGITSDDLGRWRHHPVSKIFLRYLIDYAEMLRRQQLAEIEQTDTDLSPKKQGEYKGRVNTLIELASIEFEHLCQFYPEESEEGNDDA